MKNFLNVLLVCFLTAGVMMACPPDGAKASSNMEKSENGAMVDVKFTQLNLNVKGMTCAGCENKVKAALGGIDGVVETQRVDSKSDEASLTFDPTVTTQEEIIKTLSEKTGYSITVIESAGMNKSDVKACSKECAKDCCKNKSEAEKAACGKAKASGVKDMEEQK